MAERREIKNLFIQLSGSVVSVLTGVSNWGKAVNCIYRHRGSWIYSEYFSEKDQIRIAAWNIISKQAFRITRICLPCNYEIAVHDSHYLSLTYEYNVTVNIVQLFRNNPSHLVCLTLTPTITARLLLIYPRPQASEVFASASQQPIFVMSGHVRLSSSWSLWKDALNKGRLTRKTEMPFSLWRN